jgi:hypothetical protein
MPAVRRQFAKRTRSHLPPRASRAALGKDSSPFYYSCHITERMCSCSNFVVDTNWYGMTVQMNFDRYETRKVARADDFGYYVQSITTGSALVTTITKSISRGGLTGVAFLAFVASVWAIITHQAQDALDDGGSLRLTIHYTFIPVPIAWFTTDTIWGSPVTYRRARVVEWAVAATLFIVLVGIRFLSDLATWLFFAATLGACLLLRGAMVALERRVVDRPPPRRRS